MDRFAALAYIRVHRPDGDHLRAERRVLRHSDRLVGGGEYELRGVVIEILRKTGTLDDDNKRIQLDTTPLTWTQMWKVASLMLGGSPPSLARTVTE